MAHDNNNNSEHIAKMLQELKKEIDAIKKHIASCGKHEEHEKSKKNDNKCCQ